MRLRLDYAEGLGILKLRLFMARSCSDPFSFIHAPFTSPLSPRVLYACTYSRTCHVSMFTFNLP